MGCNTRIHINCHDSNNNGNIYHACYIDSHLISFRNLNDNGKLDVYNDVTAIRDINNTRTNMFKFTNQNFFLNLEMAVGVRMFLGTELEWLYLMIKPLFSLFFFEPVWNHFVFLTLYFVGNVEIVQLIYCLCIKLMFLQSNKRVVIVLFDDENMWCTRILAHVC